MPLHWAAAGKHFEVVQYLLEEGNVPVNECDDVSIMGIKMCDAI